MTKRKIPIYIMWICAAALGLAVCIFALHIFMPDSASEEWRYTIQQLALYIMPISGITILAMLGYAYPAIIMRHKLLLILLIMTCALIFVPVSFPSAGILDWKYQYMLSVCWSLAAICIGLMAFYLARTARLAGIYCLCGSILMGLGAIEAYLLLTQQALDGLTDASAKSRYVLADQAIPEHMALTSSECGVKWNSQTKELEVAHRRMKFDEDIFDVKYKINESGWRRMPEASGNAPYDLLLFGCSFTFGYGLAEEQTWAFKLAKLLGPNWRLSNYAQPGYGAGQMLCMLERHEIPMPKGKQRYALFFAIGDHLRRNEFFGGSPHYQLDDSGKLHMAGKPRYNFIQKIPDIFNGSQLARDLSSYAGSIIAQYSPAMLNTYLGMIKESALLLKETYQTELIVLLWEDAEYMAPLFQNLNIPTLKVTSMLQDKKSGNKFPIAYYLQYPYDLHPGEAATTEMAKGLANYFTRLANGPDAGQPGSLN